MATEHQIQAVAAAMHALRPAWPTRSLATFLQKHFADRPYADLAVAGVVVALDERTKTPQLLLEHGRWWVAAYEARGDGTTSDAGQARCERPGHGAYLEHNCGACRADALAAEAKTSPKPEKPAGSPPPPEVVELLDVARRKAANLPKPPEVDPNDAA